jgi:beta-glucosidase-like glycosyl hydrolase
MESYNEVNDFFMIWNKELLTDELKTKFGFKGIMSDWYVIYSNENQHFTTGLDMNQQGGTVQLE